MTISLPGIAPERAQCISRTARDSGQESTPRAARRRPRRAPRGGAWGSELHARGATPRAPAPRLLVAVGAQRSFSGIPGVLRTRADVKGGPDRARAGPVWPRFLVPGI